jgi:hypothetical protein
VAALLLVLRIFTDIFAPKHVPQAIKERDTNYILSSASSSTLHEASRQRGPTDAIDLFEHDGGVEGEYVTYYLS